ncbi:MAG TPA: GDSL-type esterase/lipase family protein [Vicinamibacterales bacterium]|nr:GDSL-type esterase/lipase family protein [Vicinamibacterales bacterium]
MGVVATFTARLLRGPVILSAWLAFTAGACGGPTTPRPPGPFAQCPANVQVESADGAPIAVTFPQPIATGGTEPLTVSCTPASGTVLPVGAHPTTCVVTDAAGQTAACTFSITVKGPPRLTLTNFMAFGDSLTWGVFRDSVPTLRRYAILPDVPPPAEAYPNQLEQMLRARYRQQTPVVQNFGFGGEVVDDGGAGDVVSVGVTRLPAALDARPDTQALLLMEGTNDLLGFEAGADRAIEGLRRMVAHAKQRGLRVFLATIPPQRPGGRRDRVAQIIPGFNDRIRALAASEGVILVDVYDALKDKLYLISIDDLHPTAQGYVVIAQTFFDVIRAQLEATSP